MGALGQISPGQVLDGIQHQAGGLKQQSHFRMARQHIPGHRCMRSMVPGQFGTAHQVRNHHPAARAQYPPHLLQRQRRLRKVRKSCKADDPVKYPALKRQAVNIRLHDPILGRQGFVGGLANHVKGQIKRADPAPGPDPLPQVGQ